MKRISKKALTPIVLKYYKIPEKRDCNMPFFECAWCFGISNRTGGAYFDKKGDTRQICEECAIQRFKEDNGFKTLSSAKARRRRIFDVGYLLNEIVLDIHMNERRIKRFEDCKNSNDIFIKCSGLYNTLFSKEDKIKLEETELQEEIEAEINKRLILVDFNNFFADL
jgi:hypothetical protein